MRARARSRPRNFSTSRLLLGRAEENILIDEALARQRAREAQHAFVDRLARGSAQRFFEHGATHARQELLEREVDVGGDLQHGMHQRLAERRQQRTTQHVVGREPLRPCGSRTRNSCSQRVVAHEDAHRDRHQLVGAAPRLGQPAQDQRANTARLAARTGLAYTPNEQRLCFKRFAQVERAHRGRRRLDEAVPRQDAPWRGSYAPRRAPDSLPRRARTA